MSDTKPGLSSPEEKPAEKKEEGKEVPASEDKDAKAEKNRKEFDPDPDHPRYKEVWWKVKKLEKDREREKAEAEKDMEAMRKHNAAIAAKLEELEKKKDSKDDEPEPDPAIDPDAYKKWHKFQMAKKDREYQEAREKERIEGQIMEMKEDHDDYDEMIKVAERDMLRDEAIKKKIWSSYNPAKAAYKYGKDQMEKSKKEQEEEKKREENNDKGDVLGGGTPPPQKKDDGLALNDDEKRVIRNMFPGMDAADAQKRYLAQKKIIAGRSK